MIQGCLPAVRRITQSKGFNGLRVQSAFFEVCQRRLTGGRLEQVMAVKGDGLFQQGAQPRKFLFSLLFFGCQRFQRDAGFFGKHA